MKKIIYSTLTAVAVILLLQACYKDLGNYDYQIINGFEIDSIKPNYTVMNGLLTVTPEIRDSTGIVTEANEDRYTYAWLRYRGANNIDTIATTRQLINHPLGLGNGNYSIYYRVTDKNTGVFKNAQFTLIISTTRSEGFLVLNDIGGKARLDMLSWYQETGESTKDYHYITDVVGTPLPDNPSKILVAQTNVWAGQSRTIYVIGQSEAVKLDKAIRYYPDSLPYQLVWDFTPGTSPSGLVAENMERSTVAKFHVLVGQGNAYVHYGSGVMTMAQWSLPVNIYQSRTLKAASQILFDYTYCTLFDEDTRGLYRILGQTGACTPLVRNPIAPCDPPSMQDLQKDLVFMGSSNGYPFALADQKHFVLLKDAEGYWILRMDMNYRQDKWHKIGSIAISEADGGFIGAKDIDKASFFAVGGIYLDNLYYAVGGKVYKYNILDDKSYLVLDKSPATITYMNFINDGASGVGSNELYKCMMVAVENGGKGSLGLYRLYIGTDPWTLYENPYSNKP